MKIAFIQPPNVQRSGDWKKMQVARPPINIAILSSYVRLHGHESVVFDFDWEEDSPAQLAKRILAANPGAVGFTCLTPRIKIVVEIAAELKKQNPNVIIILGGVHINAVKEQSLYSDAIDYAVHGESELALTDLLDTLGEGKSIERIGNLIYRKENSVIVNPARTFIANLDELPFPAWDLLDLDMYRDPAVFDGKHMGVITSRGCPWQCLFCSSAVTWSRQVRFRSVENVIAELEHIVNKLNISNIMFYDDTFTLNKERFLGICREITQRNLNLKYYCQIRVDTVDEEVAQALASSGCIMAAIGVESGDDEILKVLGKGFTKAQVSRAVKILKEAGLPVLATYVLGSPGETRGSVEKTFAFARELDVEQTKFMICTPFPGTEVFNEAVKRGRLKPYLSPEEYAEFSYYHHVAANLSEMSDEELLRFQKLAYDTFKIKTSSLSHIRQP